MDVQSDEECQKAAPSCIHKLSLSKLPSIKEDPQCDLVLLSMVSKSGLLKTGIEDLERDRGSLMSVIHTAWVQQVEPNPSLCHDFAAFAGVARILSSRGVTVWRFSKEQLGDVIRAFKKGVVVIAGVEESMLLLASYHCFPESPDYPPCLNAFLKRKIWKATVGSIKTFLNENNNASVFIKPIERKKKGLSGSVATTSRHPILTKLDDSDLIWCSEVLNFQAEFRVFVIKDQPVGVRCYRGEKLAPNPQTILEMISQMKQQESRPTSYALDVGVMCATGCDKASVSDGDGAQQPVDVEKYETVLVELTDGFALGSYGLDSDIYTDCLLHRLLQLTEKLDI